MPHVTQDLFTSFNWLLGRFVAHDDLRRPEVVQWCFDDALPRAATLVQALRAARMADDAPQGGALVEVDAALAAAIDGLLSSFVGTYPRGDASLPGGPTFVFQPTLSFTVPRGVSIRQAALDHFRPQADEAAAGLSGGLPASYVGTSCIGPGTT